MNWAQAKALNSTIGTPQFKPLDVLIENKVDSLKGKLYNAEGFIPLQIKMSASDLGLKTQSLGFVIKNNKWYVVEGKIVVRIEGEWKRSFFRTSPFVASDGVYLYKHIHREIMELSAAQVGHGNCFIEFYVNAPTRELYADVHLMTNSHYFAENAEINIDMIYEVV